MANHGDAPIRSAEEDFIDDASALSFPASDPPCYMGSVAVAGSPPGKKTPCQLDGTAPATRPGARPGRRRKA